MPKKNSSRSSRKVARVRITNKPTKRKYKKSSVTRSKKRLFGANKGLIKLPKIISKNLKQASVIITGLIFILTVGGFFYTYLYFSKPLVTAGLSSVSANTFDSENDYNLLTVTLADKNVKNSQILELNLVMFRPSQEKIFVVEVDTGDEVFVKGVGYDTVSNLYAISHLNEDNLNLMIKTVEDYVSQPVHGFIVTDELAIHSLAKNFGEDFDFNNIRSYPTGIKVLTNVALIKSSIGTDLSALEFYRLFKFANTVNESDVSSIRFESETKNDVDNLFKSNVLSTEKSLIAVLNATTTPGLAADFARVIKKQGGEILSVGNAEVKNDYSIIYYHEFTESVKVLAENLRIDDVRGVTPEDIKLDPVMERADIIIFLGKDRL